MKTIANIGTGTFVPQAFMPMMADGMFAKFQGLLSALLFCGSTAGFGAPHRGYWSSVWLNQCHQQMLTW
ncbi:hypothetical protein L4174_009505 [Photobacterium sp. CCB-ST2H9]|uniref:hypothetical protein n=1 Tax=Photobacterium sp. CCB-ST2H9 TaxID=2912855 RepID=UPI002002BC8C|nr:hypothetical protein [Photobacterium sp. CCB-ST2H9]UTM56087.1 hypothetical protein L4174_009505 [Photobacterium sp. CCB-ST2H9]